MMEKVFMHLRVIPSMTEHGTWGATEKITTERSILMTFH